MCPADNDRCNPCEVVQEIANPNLDCRSKLCPEVCAICAETYYVDGLDCECQGSDPNGDSVYTRSGECDWESSDLGGISRIYCGYVGGAPEYPDGIWVVQQQDRIDVGQCLWTKCGGWCPDEPNGNYVVDLQGSSCYVCLPVTVTVYS